MVVDAAETTKNVSKDVQSAIIKTKNPSHPLLDGYTFNKDDEKRIAELFKEMDINKDGRIDVKELSEGLKRLGIHHVPDQAEVSLIG